MNRRDFLFSAAAVPLLSSPALNAAADAVCGSAGAAARRRRRSSPPTSPMPTSTCPTTSLIWRASPTALKPTAPIAALSTSPYGAAPASFTPTTRASWKAFSLWPGSTQARASGTSTTPTKPCARGSNSRFEYWCNLQSSDGKFSEYGPQQWNLAATAFAVKFISEALRLLKTGPPITPALHTRAIDCCRKAVHATLYDPDLMSHGKSYSNQYTNIFAGGAAFLSLYPDADAPGAPEGASRSQPHRSAKPLRLHVRGRRSRSRLHAQHASREPADGLSATGAARHLGDILLAEEEPLRKVALV